VILFCREPKVFNTPSTEILPEITRTQVSIFRIDPEMQPELPALGERLPQKLRISRSSTSNCYQNVKRNKAEI